jgi:glycosyltransferase involved in cell wall biosynthesis
LNQDSAERLKVVYVISDLDIGGAQIHALYLLANLDPQKFSPHLICIGKKGQLLQRVEECGIPTVVMNLPRKRQALKALTRLVCHLRVLRPDAIMVFGFNAEILGRLAGRLIGVKKSIVWFHGLEESDKNFLLTAIHRFLNRGTSTYMCVTRAQKMLLLERRITTSENIQIMNNGVDLEKFNPASNGRLREELSLNQESFVVGIVAALRPEKNHELLIMAMSKITEREPKVTLLIIGDGPEREKLTALACSLGLETSVRFLGNRSDIAELLTCMNVFVLCSKTEAAPLAVLEAMACGLPVVCSDVGAMREIIDDGVTGFLFPNGDVNRLIESIYAVLSTPLLARGIGESARKAVETRFSLDVSVASIEKSILEMCNS